MNAFTQLIKDCLTGKDGESYDVARVSILISVLVLCGSAIYGLSHATIVLAELGNMLQNLGMGLAAIIGGGSAGIGMKTKSEPE